MPERSDTSSNVTITRLRRLLWVGLIVTLMVVAVLLARFYVWIGVVNAPRPPPVAAVAFDTASLDSDLAIPVEMSYDELRQVFNRAVPHAIDREIPQRWSGFEGEGISVHIDRQDAIFKPNGIRLEFTIPCSGTAVVHGLFHPGTKGFHLPVSDRVSVPVKLAGHIEGSVQMHVNPNWSVTVDRVIAVKLEEAEVPIPHVGNLNVKPMVQPIIEEKASDQLNQMVDEALAQLKVKGQVAAAWAAAQKPIRLSQDPPVWLVVRPSAIKVAPIRFDLPDRLRIGVVLNGQLHSSLSAIVPESGVPIPLPDAIEIRAVTDQYHLVLPVVCSIDPLKGILTGAINGKMLFEGGTTMRLSNADVYISGDRVVVGFNFDARSLRHAATARGRVYASAAVVYNASSGDVGINGLTYDLESSSRLLAVGDWIMRPKILQRVEAVGRTNVRQPLETVRTRANALLGSIKPSDDVEVRLPVDDLKLDSFRMVNGYGIFLFRANGHALIVLKQR